MQGGGEPPNVEIHGVNVLIGVYSIILQFATLAIPTSVSRPRVLHTRFAKNASIIGLVYRYAKRYDEYKMTASNVLPTPLNLGDILLQMHAAMATHKVKLNKNVYLAV